jgi:hypothetical protein
MVTYDGQRYTRLHPRYQTHILRGILVGGWLQVFVGEYPVQIGGQWLIGF